MREKYESLSLAVLRDVAKSRGLKNISAMKKADLVELMLVEDEKEKQEKTAQSGSGRQAGSEKTEKAAFQTDHGEKTELRCQESVLLTRERQARE